MNQVTKSSELQLHSGTLCEIFGKYVPFDPRKDTNPIDKAEHLQVFIQLEDGSSIYLQPTWKVSAIRSKEEIDDFSEQQVVVKGILLSETPPSPDGSAYIKGPCMDGQIVIMSLEAWNLLKGNVELKNKLE